VVPILQVLCVLGATQSIGTFNGILYQSQGRTDTQFKIGLFLKLNRILFIVLGLQWGLIGVATGYVISSLINSYPGFFFAGRLIDMTYSELWKNLATILVCAAAMAVLVFLVGLIIPSYYPSWAFLVIQVTTGFTTYWLAIHVLKIKAYEEIKELLEEQWQKTEKAVVD